MGDVTFVPAASRPAVVEGREGAGTEPDYAGAVGHALDLLRQGLAAELVYHDLYHTEQDVLPAARRLAALSGVSEQDVHLLEVAAAYHDIGFTLQPQEHEARGAGIAADALPSYGFSPVQIATIRDMIMATRWPQSPQTLLEEILVDADLDVLGREDYPVRNQALRAELAALGTSFSDEAWLRAQLALLEEHRYFTAAARCLRDEGKRKNLVLLEKRLARLTEQTAEGGNNDGSH